MKHSLLLIILLMFSGNALCVSPVSDSPSDQKLDLSLPNDIQNQQNDTQPQAYRESEQEREHRQKCAGLSQQIDALKGKLKPAKRSALMNQYRAECLKKSPWQEPSQ